MPYARHQSLPLPADGAMEPRSLLARLLAAYDRYQQRLALAELDDALLRDVGLTRDDVRRECAQPFWR